MPVAELDELNRNQMPFFRQFESVYFRKQAVIFGSTYLETFLGNGYQK